MKTNTFFKKQPENMNTLPIWEKKKSITMTVYFSLENRDARKEMAQYFSDVEKTNKPVKTESYS